MAEMIMLTKAVSNGRQNALIVADLPNKSYENESDAVSTSQLLINAGADAVKLEGRLPDVIKAIIKAGIPVMGHLGLQPQTATKYITKTKMSDYDEYGDILEQKLGQTYGHNSIYNNHLFYRNITTKAFTSISTIC